VIARSNVSLADEADERRRRRSRAGVVAVAILATLAVASWLLVARLHVAAPYAGDEPHYLIVTNSLILDGDADVKNDYFLRRYLHYYPALIDPHVNTTIFKPDSPHWYSWHGIGLSALLVPAVWAGGTRGATMTMVGVAALVLLLAFLWARRFTGESLYALVATAALAVSPFFLGLEGRIFGDLVTAAVLLGCLLLLETARPRPWQLVLLGVLVGLSPWIHFKDAQPFGAVAAIAIVQVGRSSAGRARLRNLALLGTPILVSVVGYELNVRDWYGSWLPWRMVPPGRELFAMSPARGLAAASFDSAYGLLANNPALLLVLAGLPIWLVRAPKAFLRLSLVVGSTILVQATFNDWMAGYTPPGRYALQFAPTLVPAIALFLREAPRAVRVLAAVLIGIQFALAAAFVWLRPGWAIEGTGSPFLQALDRRLGVTLEHAMPTFSPGGALERGGWQLVAWLAASVLLVVYGIVLARRIRAVAPA
jgi:hypothetical protein